MKFLGVLILTLFFGTMAFANSCRDIFREPLTVRNFSLKAAVFVSAPRPELGKNWWEGWHAFYGKVEQTEMQYHNGKEGYYSLSESNRGFGLQGEIFMQPAWFNDAVRGVDLVHQSYGKRLSEQEKKLVKQLDEQSFNDIMGRNRLGYAGVEMNRELVGFLRVVDGKSGPLPAEIILQEKQIQNRYFNEVREAGLDIFEIGKYALRTDLNPAELKEVRKALLTWLATAYMSGRNLEKTIFIIDVSSAVHERAYRTMFGAEKIDSAYFTPALQRPDAILQVNGRVLLEHLNKIIGADRNVSERGHIDSRWKPLWAQ